MLTSNNAEERLDRIERHLTYLQQRQLVGKAADVVAEPVPGRALSVQVFSNRPIGDGAASQCNDCAG
jgi:hypothetical protein